MRHLAVPLCLCASACGAEPLVPAAPPKPVTPAPIATTNPTPSAGAHAAMGAGPTVDALSLSLADDDEPRARDAAVVLATSADPRAHEALADAMLLCEKTRRSSLLEALRDRVGASGLIIVLDAKYPKDAPDRATSQRKEVMDMLRDLADPRGADALLRYLASEPPPHWKTEAAFRLAELGDVRAAPTLGWRLAQEPMKLYDEANPEYRRDDNERVVAARLLAELATLHPERRGELRAAAETQTLAWLADRPEPHANGLRFLATADSTTFLPKLRAWADPKEPLPKPGTFQFPAAFMTAQSALRYTGRAKAPDAFKLLERQLHRRPATMDASMNALTTGGQAVLGLSLRSLGVGAAHGFAELGDPRAAPLLMAYIEDPKENEQARLEACFSLAWVATDATLTDVAKRAASFAKGTEASKLVSACYLETLARRTTPDASRELIARFMVPAAAPEPRTAAARAVGLGGVPDGSVPALLAMLSDKALANDAALALLLGGPTTTAPKAAQGHAGDPETVKVRYQQSFDYVSQRAYADGHIARWARNADACGAVTWPVDLLSRALVALDFDHGPHSLTRTLFRYRLWDDAKNAAEPKKSDARRLLEIAREKGVLMSLR